MKLSVRRYGGILVLICALGGCFGSKTADVCLQMDLKRLQGKTALMPVAVIGSGPAGLMAATYCARGGKTTFVIEGNKPGGLLMDTTDVENWPGQTTILGPTIIENLRTQAKYQGVTFIQDAVERIDRSQWPYTITTENGQQFHALSIIIATGATPRKLGVMGEEGYWGAGVTACAVCDAPFYKGQEVVVVGGGDSAIEEAIQLTAYAKRITILVRKDRMRATASMVERVREYDHIQILYNVEVRAIEGDGQLVTGVELYNTVTGQTSLFATNGVFLAIGHDPNSLFAREAVAIDAQGYIRVKGGTRETSAPGIFAAGDVADFQYRQAGTAAGQGIAAGLEAVRFLDDIGFTPDLSQECAPQFYGVASLEAIAKQVEPINITMMAELRALINQENILVIDFWSETCPSCKLMLSTLKTVAQEFATQVTFVTVDTDQAPEIVQELFVHKIPCVMIFKNGLLVERSTNVMSRNELSMLINGQLGAETEKPADGEQKRGA